VAISFGFAEDRAMLAFEVDPGDGEPKFFGVTAERDGDRIADRDPGWQADVVIGPAGAGHDPTATFGQHTWAPRCYRLDGIGLISSSRAETACGDQEARNPDTKRHQPSPITFRTARGHNGSTLSVQRMSQPDAWRMIRRPAASAGIAADWLPHDSIS
jgi:hypothetical protein